MESEALDHDAKQRAGIRSSGWGGGCSRFGGHGVLRSSNAYDAAADTLSPACRSPVLRTPYRYGPRRLNKTMAPTMAVRKPSNGTVYDPVLSNPIPMSNAPQAPASTKVPNA